MSYHASIALAFISGIALSAVMIALICSVIHDMRQK